MKKMTTGVIIVLIGAFLLLVNVGIIPYELKRLVFSWQTLLIAIGTVFLFDRKRKNKDAGVILIFIGTLFLLPRMFYQVPNMSGIILSGAIIAVGIYLVVRGQRNKRTSVFENYGSQYKQEDFDSMPFSEVGSDHSGFIKREYAFSGSKERISGEIKGVEVDAAFSGVEIDFSQAELARDAKTVRIKVTAVFGGVTVYIPSEWNVLIQKTGMFGSFVDKRHKAPTTVLEGQLVILELEAVFGGGEIRCFYC